MNSISSNASTSRDTAATTPGVDQTEHAGTGGVAKPTAQSHWIEKLTDGTPVTIRPIRKDDAELEREFIKRLSPASRRMRFLGQMNEPGDELIRSLTDIDYVRNTAEWIARCVARTLEMNAGANADEVVPLVVDMSTRGRWRLMKPETVGEQLALPIPQPLG